MSNYRHLVLKKSTIKNNYMWLHSLLLYKKKNHTVIEFENITVTSFQVTSPIDFYYCKTWLWDHICTYWIFIPKLQTLKFGKPSNYRQLPQQMDWKNTLNQSTWKIIWYHFSHGSKMHTHTDSYSCSYFRRCQFYCRKTHNFSDDALLTRPPTLQLSWKLPF